jgi:Tfp pilus assembly protein PilX
MLIVVVLVCLTLVTVLAGVWMKLLSVEQRQVRSQQDAVQAEYLAEAGLARAAARLAADSTYTGEVWQPSAVSLGAKHPAKITISVAADSAAAARTVSVAAQFPEAGPHRALRSRTQTIHLPTSELTP